MLKSEGPGQRVRGQAPNSGRILGPVPELSAGYSLLETMVTSAISIIVFAGFFSIFGQFQTWSSNLNLLLERDANLWLAPLLFSRWITPTGNNRWNSAWSGVTVQADRIELNSDIHGPGGFPDSQLSSSFEALVLRSSRFNLQVKSGNGSFQPVIKNVADFQVDVSRQRKWDTLGPRVKRELEGLRG